MNDQGGSCMSVSEGVVATLRTEMHGHPPCVAVLDSTAKRLTPYTLKIRSGCAGGGKGALIQENKSATLSCNNDQTLFEPCGCYGIGRDTFNQGQNAKFSPTFEKELQLTLVARGPGAVQIGYTVRRLTPLECARLQGFPDWWGEIEHMDEIRDDEYQFWLGVRNTHAAINGKTPKEYTRKQMLAWYNKLHTDSAEYKMWGNGIALPTALYVMQGIADCLVPTQEVEPHE